MPTSITLEQIITFLLETPMFGDLDPTELSQIVHIMQIQRVRDGHAIFREGDAGDAWYVLYSGRALVQKASEFLPSRTIATMEPRACLGEMAILDHSPRSATVVAQGDVTVFRFPRSDFEALLQEGNLSAYKLIYEMAKVLATRARRTTQQLADALADQENTDRVRHASMRVVQGQSISE